MGTPITEHRSREICQRLAWALKEEGHSYAEIARSLNVTPQTVSRWLKKTVQEQGVETIYLKEERGRKSHLTPAQQQQLLTILTKSSTRYGFWGDFWTYGRIRKVIQYEFGIVYTEKYLSQLLTKLDWQLPKPERCLIARARLMEQLYIELNGVMGNVSDDLDNRYKT